MTLEMDRRSEAAALKVMRTPRSVDLEITARCNLRCRYCYFFNNPGVEYVDLPTEEWLRFFDELGRCGVMRVCLLGGEPFIREDLPELLMGIVRNRMRFSILSNGSLIDDEIAAFIVGTGRCDHVQVSVDGSSPETHDAGRGKGSFEGAIRGIRTLQEHGAPVTARVTIHQYNVKDLADIAHFLLEDLGLATFGTNAAGYLGNCRQYVDEILLTVEERQAAMGILLGLAEKYPGRISASAGPLADAEVWARMEAARASAEPPFSNAGHLTACGCPSHRIAVGSDGVIIPCVMLAHMNLGRINQDSLMDVWQQNPTLNQLRGRRRVLLADFEFCAGCEYIPYCTGNCPALAYTLVGKVDHPSPDACLRRFLEEGGTLTGGHGNRWAQAKGADDQDVWTGVSS